MSPSNDHDTEPLTRPCASTRSLSAATGSVPLAPTSRDLALLPAILINLSQEIRRPLCQLRDRIGSLVEEPSGAITDQERSQAETMLALCDDLDRLTLDYLGDPVSRQE